MTSAGRSRPELVHVHHVQVLFRSVRNFSVIAALPLTQIDTVP